MKNSFWRRWWHTVVGAKRTCQASRGRLRQRILCLEALEDRSLPSGTPAMVLDINPGLSSANPSELVAIGSMTYFTAYDGIHGDELWRSDGTAAGTTLVADINPGSDGSSLRYLTDVNGTLFFRATDGTNGTELWKSDGTAAGTVMVADIHPGSFGTYPRSLSDVNGTLFFSADDGAHGRELWKSDGTTAGTTLVKDIYPGTHWTGNWYYGYAEVNNYSDPRNLTNVGGTLFFTANDDMGAELWKSDGTAAGTVMVADISPDGGSSSPSSLANVDGTLFFAANDGTNGTELWKSDGTAAGTTLVKDIYAGSSWQPVWYSYEYQYLPNHSYPSLLTNVNGTLFFTATDGTNGYELWTSDGTTEGTVMVADGNPGSDSSSPRYLTNVNGTLFFQATDGAHGFELWQSDGTAAATGMVMDINPGSGSSNIRRLTDVNGTLFFSAWGTSWRELWKSDGTAAGTVMVADINAGGSSDPNNLVNMNGTLLFSANDGIHGTELWKLAPPSGGPEVSIGDVTVTEGNTGTRSATFTVTLSAASAQTVTVAYATADSTATAAGGDYQAASGTLTFAPGETNKTIAVLVNGDRVAEPTETFVVNLSDTTNVTIADGQAVGTIMDDEPRISISDVTKYEGKRGKTTLFTFTVTLSAAYDEAVTMSFQTVDGTAKTSDKDYVAKSGTLTFAPGETTKTITIEVKGDSKKEADETFYLDLFGNSSNSLFTKNRGLGTILNDD